MAGNGTEAVPGSDSFPSPPRASVTALFLAHHRRLVGLASLFVDDHGSTEEIVQDEFESLHKRWNGMRDPSSAVAYLDHSVVHGARSWVRRRVAARSFVPPEAGVLPSAESVRCLDGRTEGWDGCPRRGPGCGEQGRTWHR